MQTIVAELDNKIKSSVRLFAGIRSVEEDTRLYHKAYNLCFAELLAFAEEHLSENQLAYVEHLIADINSSSLSEHKKYILTLEVILAQVEGIANHRYKLLSRLLYIIESLAN